MRNKLARLRWRRWTIEQFFRGALWLSHPDRATYQGITLVPEVPERASQFIKEARKALILIERSDARRWQWVKRYIRLIVDTKVGTTWYRYPLRSVEADLDAYASRVRTVAI